MEIKILKNETKIKHNKTREVEFFVERKLNTKKMHLWAVLL